MDKNTTSYNQSSENYTEEYIYNYENCTGNYCITPVELCEPDNSHELATMYVQVSVYIVAFLFGVIGNSLVIATFAKYRRLRLRCMTDVFLFFLSISDLLLLLTLPLETTEIIRGYWVLGNTMCKINYAFCAINTYIGLLLLACISIDRYLLVVRARTAVALRSSMLCYSKMFALGVVLFSLLLSLPELLYTKVSENTMRCEYIVDEDVKGRLKMWPRVAKIVGSCLPWVIMLVCYSTIGHVLTQGRGKCFRRQKTLRLIVALIVNFCLFQLPYPIVQSIRMSITSYSCELWSGIHIAEDITRSLAYVRCCLNPVLYALMGERFRKDVLRFLRDCGFICNCLSHLIPKLEYGSSVTHSSPPPTSTMLYEVTSPKIIIDTDKNPAGVSQAGVTVPYQSTIFFPSTFPESQQVFTSYK